MKDDFFLKKMKGVKPFNKEKDNRSNKKNIKTINTIRKKSEENKIFKENILIKKNINSEFNISFSEINKDLKRGRIKIDRRVDLHGYTLTDAYQKFKNEVRKTYKRNQRCILVITGKGVHQNKNTERPKPKLFYGKIKNSIVSWIKEDEFKRYILTYQDAGFEHGGQGAIFVYLRKNKT